MTEFDVCHVSSVHMGLDVRIYLKQCRSLSAAGYKVALIIHANEEEVSEASVHNIRIYCLNPYATRFSRMLMGMTTCFCMAMFTIRAKIYQFHDPELLPIALLLAIFGKNVVFDYHENYAEDILTKTWLPKWLRGGISWIFSLVEYVVSRLLKGKIAATASIMQDLSHYPKSRIVLNNYPFKSEFMRFEQGLQNKRREIAYIGMISEARGLKQLVDALPLANVRLNLAGNSVSSEFMLTLAKSPGWPFVNYFGHVSRSEVFDILRNSSIGVVVFLPGPNHTQSQPNKLFEYMAAKLPVICSNFPLWNHLVVENGCGISVNPFDSREIAKAINLLLDDPLSLEKMGENGERVVRDRYNWEVEEKKYLKLCNDIISQH